MPRLISLLIAAGLICGCSDASPPPDSAASSSAAPVTQAGNKPVKDGGGRSSGNGESEKHVVLAADAWCPHNCKAGAAKEGYMVDVAREALEAAGYTVDYRNVGWARALRMARQGELNAVVGAFRTDAPDFVFPSEAQGRASIALFTHPDSDWTYSGLPSLESQTLLVINGYSYTAVLDTYIEQNREKQERIEVISGTGPLNRALRLLQKNRIDVFAEDDYVVAWELRKNPDITRPRRAGRVSETLSYVAFSPAREDSAELAHVLSEGTRKLVENGRMAAILDSYGLTELPETP